jgi:hypothetical protein
MIQKVNYTGKEAAELVKKFCNIVFRFHVLHHTYKELFEDEDAHILMENTANSFFSDLNTILHHYILLEFAKITDPAKTGKNENFTIDNLIESIDWPEDILSTLTSLSDKAKKFRDYLIEARHKLLAHMDKGVHLNGKNIGGFPEGEEELFLQTLKEICETTHKACFDTIYGDIAVAKEGDVQDLKKTLKRALAFDKKFSESTGKELSELFALVQGDVRKLIQPKQE